MFIFKAKEQLQLQLPRSNDMVCVRPYSTQLRGEYGQPYRLTWVSTSNDMILDREFVISYGYDEGAIRQKLKTLIDPMSTNVNQ